MESTNNNSPVVEFYNNKTVFITGATGFMGKVCKIELNAKYYDKPISPSGAG